MVKYLKNILCVIIVGLLLLFLQLFFSFCKFNQIGIDTYTNPMTWHDTIVHIEDVAINYPKTFFIYKGRSFENIPCYEFKDKSKRYVANIEFNWDNSITCEINNVKYTLKVDSINIATRCRMPFDTITWKHGSEDSVFYMISFYDKKKNMIEISRQKSSLPYGGKRHGFNIMIDKMDLVTHNTSPFDY